jgi:hypothetical protein
MGKGHVTGRDPASPGIINEKGKHMCSAPCQNNPAVGTGVPGIAKTTDKRMPPSHCLHSPVAGSRKINGQPDWPGSLIYALPDHFTPHSCPDL